MGNTFFFENLDVYKESVNFTVKVYELTRGFPKEELYGLTSQVRRAATSIVSNICEGSNRGATEFKRYLDISRGSIFECVGQLQIAQRLQYMNQEVHQEFYNDCIKLSKMIMSLRKSLHR